MNKPSAEEQQAARDRVIPDVIAPSLRVLFCGINPGLYSAATGHHFARPGNRFWPALHRGGFTERQLGPDEQWSLLDQGLGVTNVCPRATARADELSAEEMRTEAAQLTDRVREYRPQWLAVLGVTAYRTGFGRRKAIIGAQQELIGATRIWVLPNPSGLNAHYQLEALAAEFDNLRNYVT